MLVLVYLFSVGYFIVVRFPDCVVFISFVVRILFLDLVELYKLIYKVFYMPFLRHRSPKRSHPLIKYMRHGINILG